MPRRTFTISPRQAGQTLAQFLKHHLHGRERDALRQGHVKLNGKGCRQGERRLVRGDIVHVDISRPKPAPQQHSKKGKPASGIRIVYQDEHIVVVDKPAGLTTVRHRGEVEAMGPRAQRFLPPTLVDLLPSLLPGGGRVRAVHRLDRDTSGVVVLARTPHAESHLGKQFRAHSIERRYLALVRGQAQSQRIESWLVADRGDGRRGSGDPSTGQRAITMVRVLEQLKDYALVECELETGRTHQVRIHLGESGTPLCGEKVYDRPLHGQPMRDASTATRPMLHAAVLAIDHPVTGQRLRWQSAPPKDMADLLFVSRSPHAASEHQDEQKQKNRPQPSRARHDPPRAGKKPRPH